ncbi:MAG: hypothetical protein IT302_14310 [Dehalococcoidia bacterium]|nr:hypothetical protein [Dehalococcoidia bacterium]
MFTTPSPDDMIEGVIAALQNEILPFVTNPKAQAAVLISQAILQMARQSIAAHDNQILDEHNSMSATLRAIAGAIGDTTGPAADAIRQRAATLGAEPDYAPLPDMAEAVTRHRALSLGLVDTLMDLDLLQRSGIGAADTALLILREHLGGRAVRDVQTLVVGAGMLGRG